MKKMQLWFFCCLLISLFLLSACTTTSSQQLSDSSSTKSVKKTKPIREKKALAPKLIQIIQGPDRLRVILYSDVCFQANGDLKQACMQQLLGVIKTIKEYGDGLIQVVGYTDEIYDPLIAEEITQRQANFVVAFLWSKGIAAQRLRAVGFGNHDAIASNRSVKASAANRRVEIILVK
jgi:outer membrane protein OmpA-like peptidoglycan-associated protein